MRTYVEAIEYFLPEKVVSNADLVSENPKWNLDGIEKKTGVFKRHIASENETAYEQSVSSWFAGISWGAEKPFSNFKGRAGVCIRDEDVSLALQY